MKKLSVMMSVFFLIGLNVSVNAASITADSVKLKVTQGWNWDSTNLSHNAYDFSYTYDTDILENSGSAPLLSFSTNAPFIEALSITIEDIDNSYAGRALITDEGLNVWYAPLNSNGDGGLPSFCLNQTWFTWGYSFVWGWFDGPATGIMGAGGDIVAQGVPIEWDNGEGGWTSGGAGNTDVSIDVSMVPEPSSMLLFGFGLLGFIGLAGRKAK